MKLPATIFDNRRKKKRDLKEEREKKVFRKRIRRAPAESTPAESRSLCPRNKAESKPGTSKQEGVILERGEAPSALISEKVYARLFALEWEAYQSGEELRQRSVA